MKFRWLGIVMMALLLTGCLGGTGGTPTANVGVYITDAGLEGEISASSVGIEPLGNAVTEDIEEVWVTLTKIQAKRDGKWELITEFRGDEGRINLMSLRMNGEFLGEGRIPAGTYTDFRLVTSDKEGANYIVLADGTKEELKIPSSELKPSVRDVVLPSGTVTELVFDINMKYFVERGNSGKGFIVNPRKIIRLIDKAELGSIEARLELPKELRELMKDITVVVGLYEAGRVGEAPLAEVAFEKGVLELYFDAIFPGEYELAARVLLGEQQLMKFRLGPIVVRPRETEIFEGEFPTLKGSLLQEILDKVQ